MCASPYIQSRFVFREEFMKRTPSTVEEAARPSRREFLLAGGAVVTTLTLGRAQASAPINVSEELEKIRTIMKRYGSELGDARYVEQE
jgi:hypothetical protein